MTRPAAFVFVTGHVFGRRALEGMLSSDAHLQGRIECRLAVQLSGNREANTVGFAGIDDVVAGAGIPHVATEDGTLLSLVDEVRNAEPDYLVVVGWSRLVAPEVLDIPRKLHGDPDLPRNAAAYGCIGMHPTLLPVGRGQAPLPWTIIKGLEATGLSTFFLEEQADRGEILGQLGLAVRPDETATTLFLRFGDAHFHAGAVLADALARRKVTGRPQDESQATIWPRRRPDDSRIALNQDLASVDAFVRALQWPYPLPFVEAGGERIQISHCHRTEGTPDALGPRVLAVTASAVTVQVADALARFDRAPSVTRGSGASG